jgi:hypothetical protein
LEAPLEMPLHPPRSSSEQKTISGFSRLGCGAGARILI